MELSLVRFNITADTL